MKKIIYQRLALGETAQDKQDRTGQDRTLTLDGSIKIFYKRSKSYIKDFRYFYTYPFSYHPTVFQPKITISQIASSLKLVY